MWYVRYFSLALGVSYSVLGSLIMTIKRLKVLQDHWLSQVADDTEQIQFIPDYLKNTEFYSVAVKKNAWILVYVTFPMSADLYLETAISNSHIVKFIPQAFLTPEFCMELVETNSKVVLWLNSMTLTKESVLYALKLDPRLIKTLRDNHALIWDAIKDDLPYEN